MGRAPRRKFFASRRNLYLPSVHPGCTRIIYFSPVVTQERQAEWRRRRPPTAISPCRSTRRVHAIDKSLRIPRRAARARNCELVAGFAKEHSANFDNHLKLEIPPLAPRPSFPLAPIRRLIARIEYWVTQRSRVLYICGLYDQYWNSLLYFLSLPEKENSQTIF